MSEIFESFLTPELKFAFTLIILFLVVLYILSIIWVARDAYQRGAKWQLWLVVALVPLAGVVAYCLLRPSLLQIDRDEQELEIAIKQREIMKYGECGNCGYPVESDYVVCPNCRQRLKNLCLACNHAIDPTWSICPYCATQMPESSSSRHRSSERGKIKSSESSLSSKE